MWNCTHFGHPTDEQLRHVNIYFLATRKICSLSTLNKICLINCRFIDRRLNTTPLLLKTLRALIIIKNNLLLAVGFRHQNYQRGNRNNNKKNNEKEIVNYVHDNVPFQFSSVFR